ncbi:MAG TPA: ferredoxin reductase family protein [Terrimesophilobacter sp.]|nr:ferredoxin reductase family protein [Terrimesophilobacter sp.]
MSRIDTARSEGRGPAPRVPQRESKRERDLEQRRYLPRMRLADSLASLVWLSVSLVLALFLADAGLADFRTVAGSFTGLGIIAGLVGTDLLLIQLLLAARVPAIDRAFGHDRALATHQRMSKPVFYLITAHVVFLWLGYAATAHVNVIAEVNTMFETLPDMKIAYLGYALLTAVVVTSLVIVRRKFAYEAWHLVHFLAYAAVLVALPHQFSTSQLFAAGTWARYYWLLLYSGVAVALVVYRFIIPIVRTVRHDLRVSNVRVEASGVYSIEMTGRSLDDLRARGGQYFIWRFWARGLWWHAHPFSLSAAPGATSLRITVRELGNGTHSIGAIPIGTPVSIEGPYGLFTDRARTTRRAVAVAAGIGITPILSLLGHGDFAPGEMTVIVRAPDEHSLFLFEELRDLCAVRSIPLHVFTGPRPARGRDSWLPAREAAHGNVSLATIVPDVRSADLFVCGPRRWTDLVINDAKRAGIPKFRIHYERFNW